MTKKAEVTFMSSKQDIFDFVSRKIIEQGGPCVDEYASCYYRHDGRKCAMGWLIPDNEYIPDMEQNNIDDILKIFYPNVEVPNIKFISELQAVHDRCAVYDFSKTWPFSMKVVAINHGLNYDVLDGVLE